MPSETDKLKTTELPEAIEQLLPYLTFDLDALPDELIQKINDEFLSKSDRTLGSTSKRMHSLFQLPKRLLDKFLQRVAYGEQDKVEALFTDVYQGKAGKVQEALRYRERFTDYSGRTFNCTAYEYAYWAKDTHMCRMLERYMDDATKKEMLARVKKIERTGLPYTQHGVAYCTHHFDFQPLIQAFQFYVDNYDAWCAARNWVAIKAAWIDVGKAQRDVPAHVVHEYCRPDRSFFPCPRFDEPTLPRVLTFAHWDTSRDDSWFPLPSSNSGFDFGLHRGGAYPRAQIFPHVPNERAAYDLEAIIRLDEVRTADLMRSREHLNPPAISHCLSM